MNDKLFLVLVAVDIIVSGMISYRVTKFLLEICDLWSPVELIVGLFLVTAIFAPLFFIFLYVTSTIYEKIRKM
jgi:hypothetical protein